MRSTSRNGVGRGTAGAGSGVRVVAKAFAVLGAFGQGGPPVLALGDIADHAGLPKATAHRIVTTLVAEGALQRVPHGYRLGLRLFELGERVRVKQDLREAALPFLQDLYEATHHTVHLAVLEGTEVVYIERISGHDPVRVPSMIGGRLPAHCTGLGKALLAHHEEAREELLHGRLEARTRHTITVASVLADELTRVREAGYAIDREEAALGVHCVAAPIFVAAEAAAALSVSGPTTRLNIEHLPVAVRSAANGVGRVLGPEAQASSSAFRR